MCPPGLGGHGRRLDFQWRPWPREEERAWGIRGQAQGIAVALSLRQKREAHVCMELILQPQAPRQMNYVRLDLDFLPAGPMCLDDCVVPHLTRWPGMIMADQVLPLDELAREALERLFKRDDLYFEFKRDGKILGGVAAHAATSKKPLKPYGSLLTQFLSPLHGIFILSYLWAMNKLNLGPKSEDVIRRLIHNLGIPFIVETQFTSWFNDLRTAYGARVLAEKWGDARLKEQAGRIKNLALAAPAEDGIFAAVCAFPHGRPRWKRGTLAFKPIDDYHTPDQATTGYIMLCWLRDIEPDPALLETARGLGRFFVKHQLICGAVPAWIEGGTHRVLPRLRESASTAGPMMFMAMLAWVDRDEKWLEPARRMAAFLERAVLPERKWYDYETFYSCSKQTRNPRDLRTGVLPANSMSMCWAAEGMRLLYELTGEGRYQGLMLRCLEDLNWRQQVWDAPYISINTFGGFSCMNTDAEWNDARQGMFAPVLMDSYLAAGDPDLFERGVAALRAAYTTMLHPALREVAPGNMLHYRESDRGAVYENYGHIGIDRVIAGYLEPDWGCRDRGLCNGACVQVLWRCVRGRRARPGLWRKRVRGQAV